MAMPEFTGEASLYRSSGTYSGRREGTAGAGQVVAQWWPSDCDGLLLACLTGATGMCAAYGVCVASESPLHPI